MKKERERAGIREGDGVLSSPLGKESLWLWPHRQPHFPRRGPVLLTVGEPREGGRETASAGTSAHQLHGEKMPLPGAVCAGSPRSGYVLLQLLSQELEAEKAGEETHRRGWWVKGQEGRGWQGWRQHLG